MPHPSLASIVVRDTEHLRTLVKDHISVYGYRVDLNHLDVSGVTNMDHVFQNMVFQGDISKWDVSNVTSFDMTFCGSSFNQNISEWNTSKAVTMQGLIQPP